MATSVASQLHLDGLGTTDEREGKGGKFGTGESQGVLGLADGGDANGPPREDGEDEALAEEEAPAVLHALC